MVNIEGVNLAVCPDVSVITTREGVAVGSEVCESPESRAGGFANSKKYLM